MVTKKESYSGTGQGEDKKVIMGLLSIKKDQQKLDKIKQVDYFVGILFTNFFSNSHALICLPVSDIEENTITKYPAEPDTNQQ
jgi:hypothetical protein